MWIKLFFSLGQPLQIVQTLEGIKCCTLPSWAGKTPIDQHQRLSQNFRLVVAQGKLFVYQLAHKSAEQPWEALSGLTFTVCSMFPYHHISLCFYSKSLSPSTRRSTRGGGCCWLGWGAGGGAASQLNEFKSGDQPVTDFWTAGVEDLTPFFIFACCIWSLFTELKNSGEAEWPLTLSLWGVWPEAEPPFLFIPCFMFVLYYSGP